MDKETDRQAQNPAQLPVENKDLPGEGELQEDELDEVGGGSLKLLSEMLSNVSKTRSEISMTFARNAKA